MAQSGRGSRWQWGFRAWILACAVVVFIAGSCGDSGTDDNKGSVFADTAVAAPSGETADIPAAGMTDLAMDVPSVADLTNFTDFAVPETTSDTGVSQPDGSAVTGDMNSASDGASVADVDTEPRDLFIVDPDVVPDGETAVSDGTTPDGEAPDTYADVFPMDTVLGVEDTAAPPCKDECKLGKYTCADSTTIKGCSKGKKCAYVDYVPCPPGYYCQGAGECICPPTDEIACGGTNVVYLNECGNGAPGLEPVEVCGWPGCFDAQCLPNAATTYLVPWPATGYLQSVSMIENGFFAAGTGSSLVHELDGVYKNTSVTDYVANLYGVMAFSPTQAVAVGNAYYLAWDGNSWSVLSLLVPPKEIVDASPGGSAFYSWLEQYAVWGEGIGQFFSGGARGTIGYFDGKSAVWVPTPYFGQTGRDIESMWGSSMSNVYAVGKGAVALRYDGVQWKKIHELTSLGGIFSSVDGTDADNVYVVRNYLELWHFDGAQWKLFSPHPPDGFVFNDVATAQGNTLYLRGANKFAYFDGLAWTVVLMDLVPYVKSIDAFGDHAVMAGDGGTVVKAKGTQYELITQGGMNWWPTDEAVDIWGFPDGTLFACGDGASVVRRQPDGTITQWAMQDWVPIDAPSPVEAWKYPPKSQQRHTWGRIWGSSPTDVYVGSWGVVAHFDGDTWGLVDLPGMPKDLLITTIHGTGKNDVFLGGVNYPPPVKTWYMAHYDGTKWTETPVTGEVGAVFGLDPEHWYAMISLQLHQYVDGAWQIVPGTIKASSSTAVLAAVPSGEILSGWGGWKACCNSDDMYFRHVSGKWIQITGVAPFYGVYHLEPMPDDNFLVVSDQTTGIIVDVSLVNQYMAENPEAWQVAANKVCKPHVRLPHKMYAAWVAPTGEIYFAGEDNIIAKVAGPTSP